MLALGRGEAAAFDALFERWGARLLRYLERVDTDLRALPVREPSEQLRERLQARIRA